jgi:hypothetical protein
MPQLLLMPHVVSAGAIANMHGSSAKAVAELMLQLLLGPQIRCSGTIGNARGSSADVVTRLLQELPLIRRR